MDEMKKLEPIDPEKMVRNPFTIPLKIEVTRITDTKKYIPDTDGIMHPVEFLMERQQSTKLFYFAGAKEEVFNLSVSAKSMLLYVLYSLESGKDYIRMNQANYMSKNSVKSINTYKDALKELCRYCFLSQSVDYKDVYWINPLRFFSGSRIDKYPDNVIVKGKMSR